MANTYDYTIHFNLPSYGMVTAIIGYHIGFSGSYWEPPDSDEVTVESLVDATGNEVSLSDEEWEEYYPLFLEEGGKAHSDCMSQIYNEWAKEWEDQPEIPF
jgi:hypothetical protein